MKIHVIFLGLALQVSVCNADYSWDIWPGAEQARAATNPQQQGQQEYSSSGTISAGTAPSTATQQSSTPVYSSQQPIISIPTPQTQTLQTQVSNQQAASTMTQEQPNSTQNNGHPAQKTHAAHEESYTDTYSNPGGTHHQQRSSSGGYTPEHEQPDQQNLPERQDIPEQQNQQVAAAAHNAPEPQSSQIGGGGLAGLSGLGSIFSGLGGKHSNDSNSNNFTRSSPVAEPQTVAGRIITKNFNCTKPQSQCQKEWDELVSSIKGNPNFEILSISMNCAAHTNQEPPASSHEEPDAEKSKTAV